MVRGGTDKNLLALERLDSVNAILFLSFPAALWVLAYHPGFRARCLRLGFPLGLRKGRDGDGGGIWGPGESCDLAKG